ncbi:TRAP transporter large permease subunit [Cloacibacillus sp. An23]|uniref:TRAP transporter large permease subunit n=1 Tax=Cloacibacillus sp. An23 TaxID=1965591 RepID=UPI000B3A0D12|nr:TRAP transporter large permease subunit [Cloacibacillus sp. An23]OUO92967.1 hypothetical protein B5F39_08925 [Cloacibacillus sp. An23]
MITVIVPICLLVFLLLCKKVPLVGGKIWPSLGVASICALVMGGIYNPIKWISAWLYGIDTIAWVLFLTVFGSIYAQTQIQLGTMDTVFSCFKAKFGERPRILVCCILLTLVIAGALLGGGTASIAIVGVLMIPSLVQLGLDPTKVCATLVMGGAIGSLMPPVSQAIFLSSSLIHTEVDLANQYCYFTVGSAFIVECIYVSFCFIDKNAKIVDYDENGNIIPPRKVKDILIERWWTLIPFLFLLVLVILRTVKIIDIVPLVFNQISIGGVPFMTAISKIFFIKGFTNVTNLILVLSTLVAYIFPIVRKTKFECIVVGVKNSVSMMIVLFFSALMVGAFTYGGQIEIVKDFAMGLDLHVLKFGGMAAMVIMGMLTGTQSTPNNAIFSFFGPALLQAGILPGKAAAAGAQFAAAGQGMPPADTCTFFTAGLVGSVLNAEVNPVRSMLLATPVWLWVVFTGMILLYV